jgi:hypothetical protein
VQVEMVVQVEMAVQEERWWRWQCRRRGGVGGKVGADRLCSLFMLIFSVVHIVVKHF